MNDNDEARVASRLRRRNLWWYLGMSVHLAATGAILSAAADGAVQPLGLATGTIVLAAASPALAAWLEWREPIWSRPASWLRRALGVLIPQTVAFGITGGVVLSGFAWPVRVAGPLLLMMVQLGCVVLASRAMRYPLTPELGRMPVEVAVKIRSSDNAPAVASQHDVRLTEQEIVTTVRPNFSSSAMQRIALEAVTSVVARPGRPQDSPWFKLSDGLEFFITPGHVVEVEYRGGTAVLPVYDAIAFAEVVQARLESMHENPLR